MRRVHVPIVLPGEQPLPAGEAHHLRDVLRVETGETVEVFDAAGRVGEAVVVSVSADAVAVRVDRVKQATDGFCLTIAAAVPKGDRADWMVEKLSELGVARFVPLAADRSVVLPKGRGKAERWERIAVESAKQCRRTGVMTIDPLSTLTEVLQKPETCWALATGDDVRPMASFEMPLAALTLLVGPEGGWSPAETATFAERAVHGVALTRTILRVETAAVAAAAVALCATVVANGNDR